MSRSEYSFMPIYNNIWDHSTVIMSNMCLHSNSIQCHGSGVLCDSGGGNVAEITFITEHGNVPPLLVNTDSLVGGAADLYTDGASINGVDSRIGTTEELVCSNHVSL